MNAIVFYCNKLEISNTQIINKDNFSHVVIWFKSELIFSKEAKIRKGDEIEYLNYNNLIDNYKTKPLLNVNNCLIFFNGTMLPIFLNI